MYDPKSLCADDFINHEEILATLKYAEENKDNKELVDEILEKARPRKRAVPPYVRGFPIGRRRFCSPARTRRYWKKSTRWRRRSNWHTTATAS